MKNDLRKDLHSLLKRWWKPKVTARRRNSLDLFKECERHNKGERIRLKQKGLKLKRNMRWNIKKHDQGWESSRHGLWHTKKYGQGNFIEYVVRDNQVLTHWEDQWCSGLPNAHPGRVLMLSHNRCHRNSAVSRDFPFHDEQKCYSQALSPGIHVPLATPGVQNSHTTGCFCCPSLTWSLGQRGHSKEHS